SVGTVRDGTVKWLAKNVKGQQDWPFPPSPKPTMGNSTTRLASTAKANTSFKVSIRPKAEPSLKEGSAAGSGRTCFEFKGGIGTASRKLSEKQGSYTLGVLVQANFGRRHQLQIAGVPVGKEITEDTFRRKEAGSIIIVVATDAPLLAHQLKRLA